MTKEKNKLLCRWFRNWMLVKNERAFVSYYFNPQFCPYFLCDLRRFFFWARVENTRDHLHSSPFSIAYQTMKNTRDMFGNCFFLLFSVFKNNFLFLKLKNLFDNPKWTKNKNYYHNSIYEGNWKHAKGCFQFLIFKSQ